MFGLAGWASDFKCSESRGLYYFHRWWISGEGFRDMEEFLGLTMDDLESVETMFSTGFRVYMQDDNEIRYLSAWLLRRPLPGMDRVVNVHLEGDQHFCPIETSECMLSATNACTVVRSGVPLTGWKSTKRTANGLAATDTREGPIDRNRVSMSCWLHLASSWLRNIGITRTGTPKTWRHAGACLHGHLHKPARTHVCLPGR